MSAVAPGQSNIAAFAADEVSRPISADQRKFLRRWWPLGLGLLALVGATSFRFAQGLWQQPEFEHGPLLLAIALWLLWYKRASFYAAEAPSSVFVAVAILVPSLLIYLLGVRLKASYFEFGALVPVLAGSLWLVGGWQLVRATTFTLLFVLLAAPLPAPVVFALTSGLKEWVSQGAELILHLANYPVARDGVTLRVGPYNLLLADACSGMNSLISLTAIGLLYAYLTAGRRAMHAVLLLAAVLPIAVASNIVRVLILVLITYHLGDEAGQSFLHDFAGIAMFFFSMVALAILDAILSKLFGRKLGGARAAH